MDKGAWWAIVYGVAKSRTQLSEIIFTWFHRIGIFIRRITTELTLPSLFFFFSFSPHAHTKRSWELTVRWWPPTRQKQMPENETFLAGNLILCFQPLKMWEVYFCVEAIQYVVLHYGSPSKLIQFLRFRKHNHLSI